MHIVRAIKDRTRDVPFTIRHVLHDLHRSTNAGEHKHVVELSRSVGFIDPVSIGTPLLDASSITLLMSASFSTTKATRVPWIESIRICELREELDLENLRGKFTGVTGAGRQSGAATHARDVVDGEGTFAAKGGATQNSRLEAWRQRRNDCEPGQDDQWPNHVPERLLRCCVGFHPSVTPGSRVRTASAVAEAGAHMVT